MSKPPVPAHQSKPRRALGAILIPVTTALGSLARLIVSRADVVTDAGAKLPPKCETPECVLDIELFQELRESLGNEPAVIAGIYRRFLGNASGSLEQLRCQTGAAWTTTLHALKGSAAMVGANRIAAVAARLQDAPAPDKVGHDAVRELEGELTMFRIELTAHLDCLGDQKKP
jgi:HPt (histidine-containing phosphotransfer) domain-containing protein